MAVLPQNDQLEPPAIFFGVFIGLFFYTLSEVAKQTWQIWRRTHSIVNWYLWMIWTECLVNLVFALTMYLFIRGTIEQSLGFFIGAVTLWMFQTQLLLQIIANRVGLIMVDQRKARLIKLSLFIFILAVNISVYCIWIPAHMLPGSPYVRLNFIWERVEKTTFLIVDLGLNIYFLYLVRSQLIARGMTKYWRLFHFNCGMISISVSMDLLLLGLLSLPRPYDYIQFAPVAYIVKLQIELNNAILISKIVRGSQHRVDHHGSTNGERGVHGTHISVGVHSQSAHNLHDYFPGKDGKQAATTIDPDAKSSLSDGDRYHGDGIQKTVTMFVSESARNSPA